MRQEPAASVVRGCWPPSVRLWPARSRPRRRRPPQRRSPPGRPTTLPSYAGSPATPNPINGVAATAQNPYMAPNDDSSTHNDSWQTDTYRARGPLGRNPVRSPIEFSGDCISPAFDRRGRMISICTNPYSPGRRCGCSIRSRWTTSRRRRCRTGPRRFLAFRSSRTPPAACTSTSTTRTASSTSHPTTTSCGSASRDSFVLDADFNVAAHLNQQYPPTDPPNQRLVSALPDWDGLIWFVTRSTASSARSTPRPAR